MLMRLSRRHVVARLGAGGLAALILPSISRAQVSKGPKPRVIKLRLRNGRVVAPKGTVRVTRNEAVELRWRTDKRMRLHLHGYDIEVEAEPGKTTRLVFTARVAGRFPITSHGAGAGGHGHDVLTYLEVYPR